MTTATVSVPPPLGVSQPGLAHSAKLLPATKSANPLDALPIRYLLLDTRPIAHRNIINFYAWPTP